MQLYVSLIVNTCFHVMCTLLCRIMFVFHRLAGDVDVLVETFHLTAKRLNVVSPSSLEQKPVVHTSKRTCSIFLVPPIVKYH